MLFNGGMDDRTDKLLAIELASIIRNAAEPIREIGPEDDIMSDDTSYQWHRRRPPSRPGGGTDDAG